MIFRQTKAKRKALTPIPKLLNKAQTVFNKWIRSRDADKGCISCPSMKVEHASHYFSAGHFSALRFSEMNVNGSCMSCNSFKHGNLISYRQGLVKRYGAQKVELLETTANLRKSKKWDRFVLELIIQEYSLKNKIK